MSAKEDPIQQDINKPDDDISQIRPPQALSHPNSSQREQAHKTTTQVIKPVLTQTSYQSASPVTRPPTTESQEVIHSATEASLSPSSPPNSPKGKFPLLFGAIGGLVVTGVVVAVVMMMSSGSNDEPSNAQTNNQQQDVELPAIQSEVEPAVGEAKNLADYVGQRIVVIGTLTKYQNIDSKQRSSITIIRLSDGELIPCESSRKSKATGRNTKERKLLGTVVKVYGVVKEKPVGSGKYKIMYQQFPVRVDSHKSGL